MSIYFKLVVQKYPTSKSYGNRGPPEAHTLIMHKSLSTRWDPASHPWCQNPGLLVNLPKKCESTLLWVVGWVLIVDASPKKPVDTAEGPSLQTALAVCWRWKHQPFSCSSLSGMSFKRSKQVGIMPTSSKPGGSVCSKRLNLSLLDGEIFDLKFKVEQLKTAKPAKIPSGLPP